MMRDTQNAAILADLKRGRTISPMQALRDYNCFRLAARIYDLRRVGHSIHRGWGVSVSGDKRWAEYRLLSSSGARPLRTRRRRP